MSLDGFRSPRANGASAFHADEPPANDEMPPVRATRFRWPDPASIPPRRFLFGRHAIRGFVSLTVAGGGTGKTALAMTEALAVATGRPFLGDAIFAPATVWYLGLEDPLEEYERRLAAAALHYRVDRRDLSKDLFLDSGRDQDFILAREMRNGLVISRPRVDSIIREIQEKSIELVIVDPFIGCHQVNESDNSKIEKVAREWARVAHETGCAVELVHHVRKGGGGQDATADDARGASALVNAARSVRVLGTMTKEEGERAGVDERRRFFRVTSGKANLSIASDEASWRELVSISLENGSPPDLIGVATPWRFPSSLEGVTAAELLAVQKRIAVGEHRRDVQASAWAGKAIAEALGLDLSEPRAKDRCKSMLAAWIGSKALKEAERPDEKGNKRKFVEVGTWAT